MGVSILCEIVAMHENLIPDVSLGTHFLNELVDHYLKSKAPKNRTKPSEPRQPKPSSPKARHIPRATRDQVMLRDHERCQFVGTDGHRCDSRHNLQIDHIQPWATGGTHDPTNLRVLCAAHNRHRAERRFGSPPQRR